MTAPTKDPIAKYLLDPEVTKEELRTLIGKRLALAAGGVFDEAADLVDGLEHVAVAAADLYSDSAADTLASGGGSEWEPLKKPHELALWTDLKPSEAIELMELVVAACDRVKQRCVAIVLEELVGVGVAFQEANPMSLMRGLGGKAEASAGA